MAKKYIDADLLRAEIEKRLKNVRDYMNGAGMRYKGPKYYKAQGKESAYDALLNTIDSLQQEQPEVDLEKEIERFYGMYRDVEGEYRDLEDNMIVCPWYEGENQLWIKDFASHFYGLGRLNARKED